MDLHCPLIAAKAKPGQFVIIRANEHGERIPLTIADCDAYSGVITIIFQIVGKSTALLRGFKAGDYIKDVVGPLGKPAEVDKVGTVIVVGGGGNVAMDSARNALRCGAAEVTVVYRRSRKELPAREEEVRHAMEEGINFKLLTSPIRFIGNDISWVKSMECVRMELGEPDAGGRRSPIPIEGSNFMIETDLVIISIGTGPSPLIFANNPNLERNRWGYIVVNHDTMETSIPNVYAGGDIVTGSATVISAMGAGRMAANAIHKKLSEE